MCGVNIVYDVHYDLEDNKKGDATFLLRYDDVFFRLNVFREHNTKEAVGSLSYLGTNSGGRGQWDMSVKTHPNLPQIQLIARTVRIQSYFCIRMIIIFLHHFIRYDRMQRFERRY